MIEYQGFFLIDQKQANDAGPIIDRPASFKPFCPGKLSYTMRVTRMYAVMSCHRAIANLPMRNVLIF